MNKRLISIECLLQLVLDVGCCTSEGDLQVSLHLDQTCPDTESERRTSHWLQACTIPGDAMWWSGGFLAFFYNGSLPLKI
jgi:hypothetical protein